MLCNANHVTTPAAFVDATVGCDGSGLHLTAKDRSPSVIKIRLVVVKDHSGYLPSG